MSCDKRKTMKLAAAIVLSSALGVACCGTRKAAQNKDTPAPLADTIEQFTPLHPPVVIPHDWRDELKDAKQPSATEENN